MAKIAITLEAYHAVDGLQVAFYHMELRIIVKTDQRGKLTAEEFVQAVKSRGKLTMEGRGALRDKIIVERFELCNRFILRTYLPEWTVFVFGGVPPALY